MFPGGILFVIGVLLGSTHQTSVYDDFESTLVKAEEVIECAQEDLDECHADFSRIEESLQNICEELLRTARAAARCTALSALEKHFYKFELGRNRK